MHVINRDFFTTAVSWFVALLLLLTPLVVEATGSHSKLPSKPVGQHQQIISSSSASNSAASTGPIDLNLMNNPIAGDTSFRTGNSYSLVSGAAPLPPGLCPKGQSVSVVWGLFSWSTTATEHECLDKVLAYAREAIPKPPVTNYITNYAAPLTSPQCATTSQTPVKKSASKKKPEMITECKIK